MPGWVSFQSVTRVTFAPAATVSGHSAERSVLRELISHRPRFWRQRFVGRDCGQRMRLSADGAPGYHAVVNIALTMAQQSSRVKGSISAEQAR